jgi:hypothetical protein
MAVDKALEFAEAAVGNADAALAVPNANAFVMASELYDSRQIAFGRGELVKVPEIPHQMLAAILRGRIEDLIGWGLLQKDKPAEAAIRFRRAVAILPEKSAWWRAGMWRLGSALQADGKEQEALDTYIKSYSIDKPDLARYTTVESLYKKLNGSTEGLEAKIGPIPLAQITPPVVAKTEQAPVTPAAEEPKPQVSIAEPTPTPQSTRAAEPAASTPPPLEEKKVEITPSTRLPETESPPSKIEITASPTPQVQTPVVAEPTVTSTPEVIPSPTPLPTAAPAVESSPTPAAQESPKPDQPKPEIPSTPLPTPAQPEPSPTPEIKIEPAVQRVVAAPTPSPTPDERSVSQVISKPPDEPRKEEPPKPAASNSPKPLFEPIIITIPRSDSSKSPPPETENSQRPTLELSRPGPESRPRVIVTESIRQAEPSPCQINISQERLSLINSGGSQSVVVGVDRPGTLNELKFVVSDPEDISVRHERDVSDIQGRNLYVVRSISERTGTYRVTFYLPCGKRDLSVAVR